LVRLLFFILFCHPALAHAGLWPSTLNFFYSADNDQNQNMAVDVSVATEPGAIIFAGLSYSHLQFSELDYGTNQTFYLGVGTNPLNDWVVSWQMAYNNVSDQMQILNPSMLLKRYFSDFFISAELGYRRIETILTAELDAVAPNLNSNIVDENLWWGLGLGVNLTRKFNVNLGYRQYQYSKPFQFFTFPRIAQRLGYKLDTINYGASFAKNIAWVGFSYFAKNWDIAVDITTINNEFDSSRQRSMAPSFAYQIHKDWRYNITVGATLGETDDFEDRWGGFASTGLTYFW
jgi:hypothetical protein